MQLISRMGMQTLENLLRSLAAAVPLSASTRSYAGQSQVTTGWKDPKSLSFCGILPAAFIMPAACQYCEIINTRPIPPSASIHGSQEATITPVQCAG